MRTDGGRTLGALASVHNGNITWTRTTTPRTASLPCCEGRPSLTHAPALISYPPSTSKRSTNLSRTTFFVLRSRCGIKGCCGSHRSKTKNPASLVLSKSSRYTLKVIPSPCAASFFFMPPASRYRTTSPRIQRVAHKAATVDPPLLSPLSLHPSPLIPFASP